uniref:Methyltransferase domain-containing protein n=1 Tax=viral metagenome TaxID=1070528 RepID=A0A6C0D8V9_9ZZZZ
MTTYSSLSIDNISEIISTINNIIISDINKIYEYDINNITKLSSSTLQIVLSNLCNKIRSSPYSYKLSCYEVLIKFITNIIIKYHEGKKVIDLSYNNFEILKLISTSSHGITHLKNIKNIINETIITQDDIFDITRYVAAKGLLPSYLFWTKFTKPYTLTYFNYSLILSDAIKNSDDRIFKILLKLSPIDSPSKFYKNNEYIEPILTSVLISVLPKKFLLRRIKLLSEKTNLKSLYPEMITHTNNISILNTLSKYYYNEVLKFNNLDTILSYPNISDYELNIYYNILKTESEKIIFYILCNINGYSINKKINCNTPIFTNILNTYYLSFLGDICKQPDELYNMNPVLTEIFKYYVQNKYTNIVLDADIISTKLLKYTKFYVCSHFYIISIKINKILHLLRCLMKRKFKLKNNNFKLKFTPILNEINNYIPSDKCNILKYGSNNYQLNKQKFNTLPPRHILPMEDILNKSYLIKEKADGILSMNVSINTFPRCNELLKYEIKSEFIEELNMYLVFDINIPNLTIFERQLYLRNLHYMTANKTSLSTVSNLNELIAQIDNEKIIIDEFIKCNNDVKWYPKAAWKVVIDKTFYVELLKIIGNDSTDYLNQLFDNRVFNIDGLILTPLDGSRELKIKPKNLLTIDLLYSNNKWIDSDNIVWTNIKLTPNKKYKNKIYRCYPYQNKSTDNVTYIPIQVRYDKKKPNSNFIVDQLTNIYKFNWLYKEFSDQECERPNQTEVYYQFKCMVVQPRIKKIINNQRCNLNNMIKLMNPSSNKNWLDLGCGTCSIFSNIKKIYFPKKYTGIDSDINLLSSKYNLVDENPHILNLYPIKLNEVWDNYNIWNTFDWTIKYDYIVANFSLMHFYNELFMEQLNKVVKPGTRFLFNIVKQNSTWKFNDLYLKSNENTTLKLWHHSNEISEALISNEQIIKYINKYAWKIVNENEFNGELANCYKWYIIEKL